MFRKHFSNAVILSIILLVFTVISAGCAGGCGCNKVPAGNVGIKFYLLGGDKGVDYEPLTPGRYWMGINEELYLFPTFTQNYTWKVKPDDGSERDESFNFQDIQGLELNADIGITYKLDPNKIPGIFQKYKRGIDEITDIFLRNMVRDALVSRSSKLSIEYIYGEGRTALMDSVESDVKVQVEPIGIIVEKIYWIGRIKIPEVVKNQIESKVAATQEAIKRENELREAEAKAKKVIAEAEGIYQSNLLKTKSITPELLRWEALQRWDGKLPMYFGGSTEHLPFIAIK